VQTLNTSFYLLTLLAYKKLRSVITTLLNLKTLTMKNLSVLFTPQR